jgi:hypothetical protein
MFYSRDERDMICKYCRKNQDAQRAANKFKEALSFLKKAPEGGNKKGEGRFSFTFLRRDISPATL